VPASPHPVSAPPARADVECDPLAERRDARRRHQERIAPLRQRWIDRNGYYYECVYRLLRFIIEPGKRVLNVRCQTGHFLDAVSPSRGVGVEISQRLVDVARARCPRFTFVQSDPERLDLGERFDYILVGDLSDTVDVVAALRRLVPHCEPHTRIIVYGYNPAWQPVLALAGRVGLRMQPPEPNWLSEDDVRGLLRLTGFQVVRAYRVVLIPKRIPFVSEFVNRIVACLPFVSKLCLVSVVVARPEPTRVPVGDVSVSVVVPCRNERGNVAAAVERMPHLGRHTEMLFCDDRSTDGTADEVRRMIARHPDRDIRLIDGPGVGKAENVWTGFRASRGDILIILDGDLTVMPEELPNVIVALTEGSAELVNGSRMVYPMPKSAMSTSHIVGNKMMSVICSYLLDHHVKDTLCGTKALWRRDWERIDRQLGSWGVEDRWGDHELLFGAARLQLAIADMPVHYRERVYGVSKMVRVVSTLFRMLRMCAAAGPRLKTGA